MIRRRGVGTVIKETLASYYIVSHVGCWCDDVCKEMDHVGPDVVEQKLDYYVDKMHQGAKQWKATGNFIQRRIPSPPQSVLLSLIEYGIKICREEAIAYQQYRHRVRSSRT